MKYCSLLLFCSIATASPEIFRLRDVANYIDPSKKTFIAFDIDNTLVTHDCDIGSDHWCDYMVRQKMAEGCDKLTAYQHVLPLYFHLNLHVDLICIEETVAQDVEYLKGLCEHSCCLTARSVVLLERTVQQLRNHGLFFSVPGIEEHQFSFAKPCCYKHGVLWCGWNNKGLVLKTFFELIGYTPDVVIFIDDKQYNLDGVQKALEGTGIEFIGLRYAGCDHKARMMDVEQMEVQLQDFLKRHPFSAEQFLKYL